MRMAAPRFSVIVPTRDREALLGHSLRALARLERPAGGFEVIVVDDGSRRPPDAVLADRAGTLELSLHTQANAGPAAARNAGAERARGELLAFVDDDVSPEPAWLLAIDRASRSDPKAALGGAVVPLADAGHCAEASELIVEIATGRAEQNEDPGRLPRFLPTSNLVVPAEAFARVGRFNPAFRVSEDREFCRRWRRDGRPIRFVAEAICVHRKQLSVPGFARQHYLYGQGAFSFQRGSAHGAASPRVVEPAFYRRLLKECGAALGQGKVGLVALLALWQLANAAGYVSAAIRAGRSRGATGQGRRAT